MATKNKADRGNQLRRSGLTVAQENAVDALASGKSDAEVADLVGVNRVTVTRWRLYSPPFQAALNERRQANWAGCLDRLRSLLPVALDAVADTLANAEAPDRLRAAFGLLKLVPLTGAAPTGPTDADEIVRKCVLTRREQAEKNRRCQVEDEDNESYDESYGIDPVPSFAELTTAVWNDLDAKLNAPIPAAAEPSGLLARQDDAARQAGVRPNKAAEPAADNG
jgi:hypothetical protein